MSQLDSMWTAAQAEADKRKADRPLSFYGKLSIEGRQVVLGKGLPGGKRDFDPTTDAEDDKRMSIRLTVAPISDRATRDFEREFLVSSPEGGMFRDAMVALGVDINTLAAGPYVRVDVVEDPRLGSFNDRTTGVARTRSTGLLREIFPDEATCRAASEARYSRGGALNTNGWTDPLAGAADCPTSPARPANTAPLPSGGAAVAPASKGINRETAAKFFPGIWQRQDRDPDKFLAELAANKMMAQHFEPTSPEVLAFLEKMGHGAMAEYLRADGKSPEQVAGAGENPIDLDGTPF